MGGFFERSYDYTKEHKVLDHDDTKVWCTHCGKVVEERGEIPDYSMFMGGVWAKQNLPCKPYAAPTPQPNATNGKEKA